MYKNHINDKVLANLHIKGLRDIYKNLKYF